LKLSPLLFQYLSANKQLNLSGIGRFSLSDIAFISDDQNKQLRGPAIGNVSFEQDSTIKEDLNLVSFIAEQSGKMKSLASADLDSFLEQARQFLNIGKPFLLDGIGTLNKNKFGQLEFTQTNTSIEKEATTEGKDVTSTTEESFTNYEEMFSPKKPKMPASRKLVTWLMAAAGISLAVFGGYIVYNRTKPKDKPVVETKAVTASIANSDTALQQKKDSIPQIKTGPVDSLSGTYRFVVEKAAKQRAIFRYNFLKSNFIDIKMDTKDSILFKLYFLLPSSPADTAHKRDSLQRLYSTRGKTTIELN
jgi:hypothetical protein